jgi:hypothetical protein
MPDSLVVVLGVGWGEFMYNVAVNVVPRIAKWYELLELRGSKDGAFRWIKWASAIGLSHRALALLELLMSCRSGSQRHLPFVCVV